MPQSLLTESTRPLHPVGSGSEALDVLARFVSAIEHTPLVAIQSFDREGTVCLWNITSATIYGIPAKEALGRHLPDLLQHEGREMEFADLITRIWDTGQPVLPRDWQVKAVSGNELWVYSTMFPVFREGKVHQIFCMDIDITIRKREELALSTVGANFRTLFDRSADAILLVEDDHFLDVNPTALRLFGFSSKADMVGRAILDISPAQQADGTPSAVKAQDMQAQVRVHGNYRYDWMYLDCNKKAFWSEVLCTEVPIDDKAMLYMVVRDISERKHAELELNLAAKVFENSHEGILIADPAQIIVSVNHALLTITGYQSTEIVGQSLHVLCAGVHDPDLLERINGEIEVSDHWQGELWGRHRNGRGFPMWLSVTALRGGDRLIVNYIVILTDISERKASEEHIRHLAEHDFLTGLPNRVLLLDRLQQAIAIAHRQGSELALLFLDLDRFKNINDSLGHQIGDKLLQEVALRLKKCVRGIDSVSRLGGDEFIILLVDAGSGDPVGHIADNILAAIATSYLIDGHEFTITTSIGISIYPHDGKDVDVLIKNADLAMYHAKSCGSNRYQFFDNDMNTRITQRMRLESCLRNALKNNEFILQYQPQMAAPGGRLIGVEALIRWQHPQAGLLGPNHFIKVAEECGLIVPIGDWVLRTACLQAKSWQQKGRIVTVSVNLSVAQFKQKNLLASILNALQLADLDPQCLEIEITESILMEDAGHAMTTLRAVREVGVKVAIDDFGTGFSSLSYLKRIAADKLKIDQSFVHDITIDADDAAIINAIIVMAKSLNLNVVAEGVETIEQFQFLAAHGCDAYQGYYLGRELSPGELTALL